MVRIEPYFEYGFYPNIDFGMFGICVYVYNPKTVGRHEHKRRWHQTITRSKPRHLGLLKLNRIKDSLTLSLTC